MPAISARNSACSSASYSSPGTNDVFNASEETIGPAIDSALKYARLLLAEFRRAAPGAKIGVALPVPPAASQDAFGANYRCRQTRWQYRRNQFHLVERMIAEFREKPLENVFLVPVFVGLDCRNNYPVRQEAVNSRNAAVVQLQCNGVHPADTGYQQIADSFYCFLKYHLAAGQSSVPGASPRPAAQK